MATRSPCSTTPRRDSYERRRPDETLLYQLIEEHWPTFLARAEQGSPAAGGDLVSRGITKISAFSWACNADGIPIIWLQDISGFDVGAEAEAQGLLGYGSSLIYTNSTNDVPMFTVLLRKASGAGYYAMAGLPYDAVEADMDPYVAGRQMDTDGVPEHGVAQDQEPAHLGAARSRGDRLERA